MFSLDHYLDHLRARGASSNTLAGYKKDLLAFSSWDRDTYGEELEPEKLTGIDLREYQEWMRAVNWLKPSTVNRRMKAMKSYVACRRSTKAVRSQVERT